MKRSWSSRPKLGFKLAQALFPQGYMDLATLPCYGYSRKKLLQQFNIAANPSFIR